MAVDLDCERWLNEWHDNACKDPEWAKAYALMRIADATYACALNLKAIAGYDSGEGLCGIGIELKKLVDEYKMHE